MSNNPSSSSSSLTSTTTTSTTSTTTTSTPTNTTITSTSSTPSKQQSSKNRYNKKNHNHHHGGDDRGGGGGDKGRDRGRERGGRGGREGGIRYSDEKDFQAEIELAMALSQAEYESTSSSSSSSSSSTTSTDNKSHKSKKSSQKVDMTHLIQFQYKPTSDPVRGYMSNSGGSINTRGSHHHNNNNNNNNNRNHNNTRNNNKNNRGGGGGSHSSSSSSSSNSRKPKESTPRQSNFLQANYLFQINSYGNYTTSLTNSDAIVSWNKIEQVIYLHDSNEDYLCPICFEPPVAAQVTKCGHITCYGCILRSLSHTSKCPLCLRIMDREELKSVVISKSINYKEGDRITLQLVKYRQGTTVPFLSSQPIDEVISFPDKGKPNAIFSRFSIIRDISPILERERSELLIAKEAAISEGEWEGSRFLASAEKEVDLREIEWNKLKETRKVEYSAITISSVPKKPATKQFSPYQYSNNIDIKSDLADYYYQDYDISSSPDLSSSFENKLKMEIIENQINLNNNINNNTTSNSTTTTSTTSTTTNIITPNSTNNNNNSNENRQNLEYSYENQPVEGLFYLYQSEDGQPVYLHPLCMKVLAKDLEIRKSEVSNQYEVCYLPPTIQSKVLEIENQEITKSYRNANKIFSYLPLTTEIKFIEIDLSNIVTKDALAEFSHELKKRRDARNNIKRQEIRKQKTKEKERENDLLRSKELREEHEQKMEKRRLEMEQEEKERKEAEALLKKDNTNANIAFLEAIKDYRSYNQDFGFALGDNKKKRGGGK